ncbi:MAG: HlyD family secretion protein [Pseudomonadales bacterium]
MNDAAVPVPEAPAKHPRLFRPEALLARNQIVDAPLRLRAPSLHVAALLLLAVALVGGGLLARQPYTEKLTVSGFAQRAAGHVAVRAPVAAVVDDVAVSEGDWVDSGSALVSLNTDLKLVDGRSAAVARMQALAAEQQALEHSVSLAQQRRQRALSRIDSALANGLQRRSHLRQEHHTNRAQWRLDQQQLKDIELLAAKGAVAQTERAQYQRLLLSSERVLHGSARAIAEHDASQKQLRLDQTLLEQEHAESSAQIRAALARLEQRRIDLQMTADQRLGAPVGGIVSGLNVRPGQRLQAGQLVLHLLDKESQAGVVLLLPSEAMGSIAVGQRVRLRYAGYPYQKFGMPMGRIERISHTPIRGADLELPVNPSISVYQAQVRVLHSAKSQGKPSFALASVAPGMQVEADVWVRSDPVWRRALEPLLDLWRWT